MKRRLGRRQRALLLAMPEEGSLHCGGAELQVAESLAELGLVVLERRHSTRFVLTEAGALVARAVRRSGPGALVELEKIAAAGPLGSLPERTAEASAIHESRRRSDPLRPRARRIVRELPLRGQRRPRS